MKKSPNGMLIPSVSFAVAVAIAWTAGPSPSALARRAPTDPTNCTATGVIQKASATANLRTFQVQTPVEIRVDASDDSHLELHATLRVQASVLLTPPKGAARTETVNFTHLMKPHNRPRSYRLETHLTDNYSGFDLAGTEFDDLVIDAAKAAVHTANQTSPPGLRFPLNGVIATIFSITPGTGFIDLDGTYICKKSKQGSLTGRSLDLKINNAGNGAGQFP